MSHSIQKICTDVYTDYKYNVIVTIINQQPISTLINQQPISHEFTYWTLSSAEVSSIHVLLLLFYFSSTLQ